VGLYDYIVFLFVLCNNNHHHHHERLTAAVRWAQNTRGAGKEREGRGKKKKVRERKVTESMSWRITTTTTKKVVCKLAWGNCEFFMV
jgi:hypothetical protein